MNDKVIGIDRFAVEMQSIIDSIAGGVDKELEPCVRKAAQTGKRVTVREIPASGIKSHSGKYVKGWSYRIKKTPNGAEGEVGNKKVPGLAHLLEKGHARVGGGRVAGHEHISKGADEAFKALEKNLKGAIDNL